MVYFYNKHDIEIKHGSTHAFLVSATLLSMDFSRQFVRKIVVHKD